MKRVVLIGAATALAAACSQPRPVPPEQWVPPQAAGVQDTRAETYTPAPPHAAQYAVAQIFLPGSAQRAPVTFQNVNGMAIYEGDIMLGPVDRVYAMYGFPRIAHTPGVMQAVATPSSSHLWPGGVIPYEIDPSVTPAKRAMIDWAVAHVSHESVLTMRPRNPSDSDYVVFTEAGGGYGCSSYVGRIGGSQEIRVAGCGAKGSVVHEIGHCAGLYHEQSRTDRDNFVTIAWSEISPGHEEWFKIREGSQNLGAYDYASIMHYSRKAFSKSGNDTIIPKQNANIGQREGLSPLDRSGLAQLYQGSPPVGPPTTPPKPQPPVAANGFAGQYSSNRGDVTCSDGGATVTCSYPGGQLACTTQGQQLDCGWFGGGQGRALLVQQPNGDLRGSYGNLLSNSDMGAWDLIRVGGSAPPPGQPPTGVPGLPTIPGLPPLPTTLPGLPAELPPGLPTIPLPEAAPPN